MLDIRQRPGRHRRARSKLTLPVLLALTFLALAVPLIAAWPVGGA